MRHNRLPFANPCSEFRAALALNPGKLGHIVLAGLRAHGRVFMTFPAPAAVPTAPSPVVSYSHESRHEALDRLPWRDPRRTSTDFPVRAPCLSKV